MATDTPATASAEYGEEIKEKVVVVGTAGSGNDYNYTEWENDPTDNGDGGLNPNLGKFRISTGYTNFSGQTFHNPITVLGYNSDVQGNVVTGEHSTALAIESDYWNGTRQTSEIYLTHQDNEGTGGVRPFMFTLANTAADALVVGHVSTAKIYAGGVEGLNGLNIMGGRGFGADQTAGTIANIGQNNFKLTYASGTQGSKTFANAFGIQTQVSTVTNLIVDATVSNAGSLITLFTFGYASNFGAGMVIGGRTGSVGSASNALMGIDCLNCANTHYGLVVRTKVGQTVNPIEFRTADQSMQYGWDALGQMQIAAGQKATAGTATGAMTTKPGTNQDAEWIDVDIGGTSYVIPAFIKA